MATTDSAEKSLEALITAFLVADAGYEESPNDEYDREHRLDVGKFMAFVTVTDPNVVEVLGLDDDRTEHHGYCRLELPLSVCQRMFCCCIDASGGSRASP